MDKKCWIGKYKGATVLFSQNKGLLLEFEGASDDPSYKNIWRSNYIVPKFLDITKEYLQQTKIKVESEDHSKFIQELAFSAGYLWRGVSSKINDRVNRRIKYLYFKGKYLTYGDSSESDTDLYNDDGSKEIFLPLPPNYGKEVESEIKDQNNSTEVEIYWNEPLKNDYEEIFVDYKY